MQEMVNYMKSCPEQDDNPNCSDQTPGQMLKEFHDAFEVLREQTFEVFVLREKLIEEEFQEVMDASQNHEAGPSAINRQDLAKELADLVYVCYGYADVLSIDLDRVLAEVHQSNMSKLGADGKPVRRADGKVLKGPNYRSADLSFVV
jgi:NTP pyrophosphatase (non-canonical NTP hydrolase)